MTKISEKEITKYFKIEFPDLKKIKFVKGYPLLIFQADIADSDNYNNCQGLTLLQRWKRTNGKNVYISGICIDVNVPDRDFAGVLMHELFHFINTTFGNHPLSIEMEEVLAHALQNVVGEVIESCKIVKGSK